MRPVTIAGCGPGSRDYLTFAVIQAVQKADLLVGPPRLLDLFQNLPCEKLTLEGNYQEALSAIERRGEDRRVVVLVTGDPGVHSFARLVIERLGKHHCNVLPGVSAVQYAFALLKMTWEDAVIFSCHGRGLEGLVSLIAENPKVAIITGGEDHPSQIGRVLTDRSVQGKSIYLFEDLSLAGERVVRLSLDELRDTKASPLNMVVIVEEDET